MKKIEAIKAAAGAVLALLVVKGVVLPGDSDAIEAIVSAALVLVAAFGVNLVKDEAE